MFSFVFARHELFSLSTPSSTSSGRNPAAGMGLAQAQAAAVQQQQKRQPFAPLPLDGNDPKRARH